MELSDLKTGMRIVTRDGKEYIVLKDVKTPYKKIEDMYISIKNDSWLCSSNYDENMKVNSGNKKFDIMKVYAQNNGEYIDASVLETKTKDMDLIWERKKLRKMTVSEICKALGYEVEIVKED